MSGEFLVVDGEGPAVAEFGDEVGSAVGEFDLFGMADEVEDGLVGVAVEGAEADVGVVGGGDGGGVEEFDAGGGVGVGDHGVIGDGVGGGALEELSAVVDEGEVGDVGVDFAELDAELFVEEELLVPELVDLDEVGGVDVVEALDVADGGGAVGAVVGLEVEEEGGVGEEFGGVVGGVEVEEVAGGGGVGVGAAAEVFGDVELDVAAEGEAVVGELVAEARPVAGGVLGLGGRGRGFVGGLIEGEGGGGGL